MSGRMLVVEDDPGIRYIVSRLLKDEVDVMGVPSYKAALGMHDLDTYNLFLLDIDLRDEQNGVDLLYSLRKHPDYHGQPIVAFTGVSVFSGRKRYLDLGFDDFLPKPFTKGQLIYLVRKCLLKGSVAA